MPNSTPCLPGRTSAPYPGKSILAVVDQMHLGQEDGSLKDCRNCAVKEGVLYDARACLVQPNGQPGTYSPLERVSDLAQASLQHT
jgi:hypothetical protein